jgi:nucleoside-diphosphate-sugar epimerase
VYATGRSSPFADALRAVVAGGRVPRIGDGRTPVDLVHAGDLALAVAAAAEGRGAGGVFNVAGPAPAPYLELVRRAAAALGVRVETVPVMEGDGGFPPWLCAVAGVARTVSCARARRQLGYAPVWAWSEITRALAPGQ